MCINARCASTPDRPGLLCVSVPSWGLGLPARPVVEPTAEAGTSQDHSDHRQGHQDQTLYSGDRLAELNKFNKFKHVPSSNKYGPTVTRWCTGWENGN